MTTFRIVCAVRLASGQDSCGLLGKQCTARTIVRSKNEQFEFKAVEDADNMPCNTQSAIANDSVGVAYCQHPDCQSSTC
jgi:hypothetical protein